MKNKSALWEWVESLVIALLLALFIRTFIIQAFKIPTGSMRMTLIEGDRILVNKFIYGAKVPFTGVRIFAINIPEIRLPIVRVPKRGDIIVFIYPEDPKKDFIKRLVGLPGETIEIRNGNLYINGALNKDPLLYNRTYYNRFESTYGREGVVTKIPSDAYFVLGDNSESSKDSRYWGFVPAKNVLGKSLLIYWPLNRIRITE